MLPYEFRALASVNRIINKSGVKVVWKQLTPAALPDAEKPWLPADDIPAEFTPKIVFLTSDRKTQEFMQYMAGAEIPVGYQRALMAGNVGFTPVIKDHIEFDGKTISVEWLDPVKPAGNVLLWKMGLVP